MDATAFNDHHCDTAYPTASDAASLGTGQLIALINTGNIAGARQASGDPLLDTNRFTLRRLQRGESLVRAGDPFDALYVVRAGFFKTVMLDRYGCEQVAGFPIQGDLIGADGMAEGSYTVEPIALTAAEVVIVPFGRLQGLAHHCPALEQAIYRAVSRELVRDQGTQWMLGSLGAEPRVAAFLLQLAERYGRLGYSRRAYTLRMTRAEMGSYLGLQLETVSRALSAFDAAGWLVVHQKEIEIRDPRALEALLDTAGAEPRRVTRPARSRAGAATALAAAH